MASSSSSSSMDSFREFLSQRAQDVDVASAQAERLVFYALPFVHDPTTHPSFRHLFGDGAWARDLRRQYAAFVRARLPVPPDADHDAFIGPLHVA